MSDSAKPEPVSSVEAPFEYPWNINDLRSLKRSVLEIRAGAIVGRISRAALEFVRNRVSHEGSGSLSSEYSIEDIRRLVFNYNPALKIVAFDGHVLRLRSRLPFQLPRLPLGYHFKGGAARLALLRALHLDGAESHPRDLDLVRFGTGSIALDQELARRHMPQDFRHGFGIEVCSSLDSYLQTRDLTLNEIIASNEEIVCTERALLALLYGIIRPTEHIKRTHGQVPGVVALKMLRFYAERIVKNHPATLYEFPDAISVTEFEFKLQLRRAQERGADVGKIFQEECEARRVIVVF